MQEVLQSDAELLGDACAASVRARAELSCMAGAADAALLCRAESSAANPIVSVWIAPYA